MELTLKNEHCAVTVTDAGAMLRSWCGTAENIFGRETRLTGPVRHRFAFPLWGCCPRGRLPHLASPAV